MNLRETLNKNPMVGWIVAGVVLVVAAVFTFFRSGDSSGPLTDKVTILFTDTGEKVEMRRGQLEMQLLERAGPVNPKEGIINPATKQPSGVIVDEGDWKKTVEKLNAMKRAAEAQSKGGGNGNQTTKPPK